MRNSLLSLLLTSLWVTPAIAAPVTMTKTASTKSDPLNNGLQPRAIPGAIVEYRIAINGATTAATGIEFTDVIPITTSFCLSGFDLSGAPMVFTDTSFLFSSGLSFPYTSVTNAADNLDFSKDFGATWTYQPTADADGCDNLITNVRVRLNGTFGANKTVQLQFRVKVR